MVEILVFTWMVEGVRTNQLVGGSLASGDVNGDGFDDVIVGSPGWGNPTSLTDAEGRADVFFGSATGLSTQPDWTRRADQPEFGESPYYGRSVASAGDVNGDGFDDILVGALNEDLAPLPEFAGAAYLYYGSPSGPSPTEDWRVTGRNAGDRLGARVASAGDVNGDGFDDVLIGAPGLGKTSEGRVLLYLGSASGPTAEAWVVEGDHTLAEFGEVIGSAGDVNGDGFDDIFLTSMVYKKHEIQTGRLLVFHGSATGPALQPDTEIASDKAGWTFGAAAASAGDVNGDGFDDMAVGGKEGGSVDTEGRVFVYLGSAAGLETIASWIAVGSPVEGYGMFGSMVGSAGDVNGDGFDDLAVGAPWFNTVPTDSSYEGRALVYLGSAVGLDSTPAWSIDGASNEYLGWSIGSPSDVNGDGLSDLLIGSIASDGLLNNQGRAQLFLGTTP